MSVSALPLMSAVMVNKMIEKFLSHVELYYIGSILRNIEIQTRIKKDEGTVEVNGKINLSISKAIC